jgi:transcriptional regulator with GAF, ATPase, and Fis domain
LHPLKSSELTEAQPWRLLARLGEGATGVVWATRRETRGAAEHVIKIGRSRAVAADLAREAWHAALALSPRLPELIDVGIGRLGPRALVPAEPGDAPSSGLVPYVVLRRASGRSLVGMERGTDEARCVLGLGVARDVGEALADLHAAGLAHGDVKPDNVLVDGTGRAALVDLGLCGPADAHALAGGTPRYLGRGDAALGDGRARDLLALGLLVAEIADPEVAAASEPLAAARGSRRLPDAVGRLCAALLVPEPGARPSAAWICAQAAGALAAAGHAPAPAHEEADRRVRTVRARYLRLRMADLGRASRAASSAAPWTETVIGWMRRATTMCATLGAEPPLGWERDAAEELAPLDAAGRRRWLVSLVGSAAVADWPLDGALSRTERELAEALSALAARRDPAAWTAADVERALAGEDAAPRAGDDAGPPTPEAIARLALGVGQVPADADALRAVERLGPGAPRPLLLAAADAMRLRGELGRALALLRACEHEASAVEADVLRRAGETERARAVASSAVGAGADPAGRALACLARLCLDAGDVEQAVELAGAGTTAALAEVAALAALGRGDPARARAFAERGLALAGGAEARARLHATLAFVTRSSDPPAARAGFREAALHAVRAGAVLEEATYRTGEAAACVDLGELEAALESSERAALLFEHVLDRSVMAARAWLARAAAFAAIDATPEATAAAERATELARLAADPVAEAYACWALADAHPAGAAVAVRASERAAARLAPDPSTDDGLQCAARLWRHAPDRLGADEVARADEAGRGGAGEFARLAWWAARAERIVARAQLDEGAARGVLAEIVRLGASRAPVPTLGRAMHAAAALARALGDEPACARVDETRRVAASRIRAGAGARLAEAARACAWVGLDGERPAGALLAPEQAGDLGMLARLLGERSDLRALLDRVLDVLLFWTRAERGLLLLRNPKGRLVARAARNLDRADLRGEQLLVSQTLAQRALDAGEPVVAVDAMAELAQSHRSVHALKLRSVLALPLLARGQAVGVVYLDDRARRGAFGERELGWSQAVAPIAAMAIADARARARLERALGRAERAGERLAELLAHKETALEVAERELARAGAKRRRHPEIVGESEPIARMLALVDRVAASDLPVLLAGESGTGKELVARAIHQGGARAGAPFVSENCGALPESLLESALFGHVRGAFTGADRTRIGLLVAAHGGTLFLDEIGEMSLAMQTKLLRVLEDGLVRPVGSETARRVDVRVITATHRDLEAMVGERRFRADLFYRLAVVTVRVPPLRERAEDIPLLVAHLVAKHGGGRKVILSRAAAARLGRHDWPGNVRQLENEVRRALLLCQGTIEVEHLSLPDPRAVGAALGLEVRAHVDRLEADLVREALRRTRGNQTQAARLLGVSRFGLHKMRVRLGLDPTDED